MAIRLQSLKTRTSIVLIAVIAVALVCSGLLGGEQDSSASTGTIGSLNATIRWTDDGIVSTAQQEIPVLGGFVTGVTTDPSAGTIALQGQLGTVTAKPAVAEGGLRLQVKSLTGLGLPLPRDGLQSALDSFATEMKRDLPAGLRVDDVQVADDGVAAHLSARNLSIPAAQRETCSPGHSPASNE